MRHWPPQPSVRVPLQIAVGVQKAGDGHGALLPTVQGVTAGVVTVTALGTVVVTHRPAQDEVGLQVEPVVH